MAISSEFRTQLTTEYGLSDDQIKALEMLGLESKEELGQVTVEDLTSLVPPIPILKARALIAKIKAGSASQMTGQVGVKVEFVSAPAAAPLDPFSVMAAAGVNATKLRFDQAKLGRLAGSMMAFVWDTGGVGDELAQHVKTNGFAYVTDDGQAETLDSWLTLKHNGGEFFLPGGGAKVSVLPKVAKEEIWLPITDYLEASSFDLVMRSAAAYERASRQGKHATRMGGTYNVNLQDDVEDPDTLRHKLEQALADAATMTAGGQIGIRSIKVAGEYANVVVPAMRNAQVIQSLGVPVGPGQDPMNVFITDRRNPHKKMAAAFRFATAIYNAMLKLAEYDPDMTTDAYDKFFAELGPLGQAYCLAAAEYASYSPKPYKVPEGVFVGFKHIAMSVRAMIQVTIGPKGQIEVTAEASAQMASSRFKLYPGDEDVDTLDLRNAMMVKLSLEDLDLLFAEVQAWMKRDGINLLFNREVLGGNGKHVIIQHAIEYLQRRSRLVYLTGVIRANRPDIWILVVGDNSSTTSIGAGGVSVQGNVTGNINTGSQTVVQSGKYNLHVGELHNSRIGDTDDEVD